MAATPSIIVFWALKLVLVPQVPVQTIIRFVLRLNQYCGLVELTVEQPDDGAT
jgi:hypothetical protein